MVVFEDGQIIKNVIQKIADSFMGSRFEIPGLGDELFEQLTQVRTEIMSDKELLKTSRLQLKEYLISINGNCSAEIPSHLEVCHNHVVRERSIYTLINYMQQRESNYIGFLWAPTALEQLIQTKLEQF